MAWRVISVSDNFLAAVRSPHNIAISASVQPPDGSTPIDLPIQDGTVTIDRFADHRRNLILSISNPLLYPLSTSDPVNVYGSTVTVSRGVRFANEANELVQLGVFRIEDASRDIPGGPLQITGWDASRQLLDQRFFAPRKFASQLATDLIQLLISEVYDGDAFPAATFNITTADATTIPKHVVDRDRWPEIQRVATVIGCEVFPDEQGVWVIQDAPDPTTATSVWAINAGEGGVLVKASNSVTREGAPNVVIAIGENVSGNDPPVHSVTPHGRDLDPNSPTYLLGPYGAVPRFYSSPHIRTLAQANRVADAQLADHLGATRLIQFDAIANPALTAGDAVTVTYPDGTSELHIIDSLTIPLSSQNTMTAQTRALDWAAQ